jgi:hypothetical protein
VAVCERVPLLEADELVQVEQSVKHHPSVRHDVRT